MTDTQTIKDRIDIVQLIGEYVQLKKAGANWKAPCPFHHEKSPSFMVHPEKQIWHCFGCGKGGDIFSFLQEMEGIDFPEALKILADRAGVKIDTFANEVNKSQKNRILEINTKAAYFFNHVLSEMPAARGAREYLDNRKLKKETIEDWQVGFIPEQWDLLTQYFLKKGYSIDDLVASGLTIRKEDANPASKKGFYDRFRGRVMFPIWDAHGNIVGFTGRVLVETERSGGKYVNTPQTLAYDKSRVLYGLNKAKTEIKNKDLAVVVEGQMDVIACHQAGMKNVVAASGTALTVEQIKLLKRYSNNIAMAFDADAAGQNAAKRGIDIAMEQGMNIKIIQIPEGGGKDADECLKGNPPAGGPQVWFKAVENAKDVMEWYFAPVIAGGLENNPKQKQKMVENLLPEIARLPYATERDYWLKILTEKLGVETNLLREELNRYTKKPSHDNQKNGEAKKPVSSAWLNENQGYLLRIENLWALILKFPKLISSVLSNLREEYFNSTPFLPLYELIKKDYNENNKIDINTVRNRLNTSGEENLIDLVLLKADKDFEDFTEQDMEKELTDLLSKIKLDWAKQKRNGLKQALNKAQAEKDNVKVGKILKEIMELSE